MGRTSCRPTPILVEQTRQRSSGYPGRRAVALQGWGTSPLPVRCMQAQQAWCIRIKNLCRHFCNYNCGLCRHFSK